MNKNALKQDEAMVSDMRRCLKELMNREIVNLSNTIEQLPPEQRINILLKLMPFVLPKVDRISADSGEPLDLSFMSM